MVASALSEPFKRTLLCYIRLMAWAVCLSSVVSL